MSDYYFTRHIIRESIYVTIRQNSKTCLLQSKKLKICSNLFIFSLAECIKHENHDTTNTTV